MVRYFHTLLAFGIAFAQAAGVAIGQKLGPETRPAPVPRRAAAAAAAGRLSAARPPLYEIHSEALSAALKHPESLLDFITDPKTKYSDRRAAALQGAKLIPVRLMPTVMRECEEVGRLGQAGWWNMGRNPLDALYRPVRELKKGEVNVAGHVWKAPAEQLPYPRNWEEEAAAPWPWQVEQSLRDLFGYMAPKFLNDGPDACREWLDVAMTMPWGTDEEAVRFVAAAQEVTHFKTPAVMSRFRRIVADPAKPNAAARVLSYLGETVNLWRDDRAQGLAQNIFLAAMERPEPKATLFYNPRLGDLRTQWLGNREYKALPVPASTVVAFAKLAMDPANGDEWTRLNCFAFPVREACDGKPFDIRSGARPGSPEAGAMFRQFADWFEKNRADLEAAARGETPELAKLRAESDAAAKQFEK